MPVVAIAGGTGKLGRSIVEAIVKQGAYDVVVLSRAPNKKKEKELSARVLVIDYSNVEALTKTLETSKVDTIIAALDSPAGTEAELALIKAADASSTTKRFIPSWFGIKYGPGVAVIFPEAQSKIVLVEALSKTNLEYTTVINGLFLDYFVPQFPSHMGPFAIVLDIPNNTAAIPGSGNVPVAFTHSTDVARFVASLLHLPDWPEESYVIGEKLTWNELLAVVEKTKGVKFDVKYDDLGKLESGEVTELPGHKIMYPYFPKQMLQSYVAAFGILFEKGFFDLRPNGVVIGTGVRGVGELVEESWKPN